MILCLKYNSQMCKIYENGAIIEEKFNLSGCFIASRQFCENLAKSVSATRRPSAAEEVMPPL